MRETGQRRERQSPRRDRPRRRRLFPGIERGGLTEIPMKRQQTQPGLFDDQASENEPLYIPEPIYISQLDDDGSEWGDFDSCLSEFGTNHCTLEGRPARVIGTPRTAQYATIEPVEFDHDPIRCCWDVVDMVMQAGGEFVRDHDDTDQ